MFLGKYDASGLEPDFTAEKLNKGYPIDIDKVDEALEQYGFGIKERGFIWVALWESPQLEIYSTVLSESAKQSLTGRLV